MRKRWQDIVGTELQWTIRFCCFLEICYMEFCLVLEAMPPRISVMRNRYPSASSGRGGNRHHKKRLRTDLRSWLDFGRETYQVIWRRSPIYMTLVGRCRQPPRSIHGCKKFPKATRMCPMDPSHPKHPPAALHSHPWHYQEYHQLGKLFHPKPQSRTIRPSRSPTPLTTDSSSRTHLNAFAKV